MKSGAPLDGVMQLDLVAQDGEQAGVVPGLLDEVVGTAAHGLDDEFDVGIRGHDDDGNLSIVLADGGDETEALDPGGGVAGVVEVEQESVEFSGGEALEQECGRARGGEVKAFRPQKEIERLQNVRLIVAHQDSFGLCRLQRHRS